MKNSNLVKVALISLIFLMIRSEAFAYNCNVTAPPVTPPTGGGSFTFTDPPALNIQFTPGWESTANLQWSGVRGSATVTDNHDINGKKCLKVVYPANKISDGYNFRSNVAPLDHYFLTFDVMFGPGFDFVKGGKLPGLCGSACNTGGNRPTGNDGWSTRYNWKANGDAILYGYHAGQVRNYGDEDYLSTRPAFTPGTLHNLTQEVILNDPGQSNGTVRAWLDGNLVFERNDYRFRNNAGMQIDSLVFSTFFGGNTMDWATTKEEHAFFCDMRAYPGSSAYTINP